MTVSAEQRREIEDIYAAFNRRDIDAVLERVVEDVVWANGLEGGYVHGRDGVREYWLRQFEQISPSVEPTALEAEPDGRIQVTVRQVVRSLDGAVLDDAEVAHFFTFAGSRIVRFDIGA